MSLLRTSSSEHEPRLPKGFPWVTYGRRESAEEFISKWHLERSSSSFVPGLPTISWILHSGIRQTAPQIRAWAEEALLSQSYPKIEVVFSGGALPEGTDARCRLSPVGKTFAESANLAAELASGDWIGFLDGATLPSPSASFQLLREAVGSPKESLIYANEARVEPSRLKLLGWLGKPRSSWYTLVHFNYIGWCWIVRRDTFLALGGFRDLPPDEAVHEFLLRYFEKHEGALCSHSTLFYRFQDSVIKYGPTFRSALAEHLCRKGLDAELAWTSHGERDRVRIQPRLGSVAGVSVVVCFRDKSEWTLRCLDALENQEGVELDIILVDNQSSPEERQRIEERIVGFRHPVRLVSHDDSFHYARMNNQAIRSYAKYPLLFLLNNDVYLKGRDAVLQTALWAQRPDIGTVGIRLCYPNGRAQHEGIRAEAGGPGRMVRVGHFPSPDAFSFETREVFANTFAACCLRREVFDAAGGLCELNWVNGFGDVAFQLDCMERGFRHLYLGGVEGIHQESASRGLAYEYWEEVTLELRYPEFLKRMVREDLAWHPAEGMGEQIFGAARRSVASMLRTISPGLIAPLKRGLNVIRRQVNMEPHELD